MFYLNAKFDNLIIDLTSPSLAEFSEEYEAYYQFYFLLKKWKKKNSNKCKSAKKITP